MATTTNFGWETPDDTDLVKDGAAAIRTALGGVDTSFVDLKGGTTGQVLAKASGTDLDYTWTTPTTVADSYGFTAGKNKVLNGDFSIWQRGTSVTAGNAVYTADRWLTFTDGATARTVSQQSTNDTTNLPFIRYCARYQRTAGNTATGRLVTGQGFETTASIPYSGKAVTLSFYARAGANFSSASSALSVTIQNGTGTDQNIFAGYTGNNNIVTQTKTLTTTWQRFTVTGTVPTNSTELGFQMGYTPVGTAGAADYFEVTGVQLEAGSTATNFQTATGTIQGETSACQRYYWRNQSTTGFVVGDYYTSTRFFGAYKFPTTMRIAPSFAASGTTIATVYSNGSGRATTNIVTGDISQDFGLVEFVTAAATAGHGGHVVCSTGSSYLEWSAEL